MYMDRGTADTELRMGFTGTSLTRVWGVNCLLKNKSDKLRSPSFPLLLSLFWRVRGSLA